MAALPDADWNADPSRSSRAHPLVLLRDESQWQSFPDRSPGVEVVAPLDDAELAARSAQARRYLTTFVGLVAVSFLFPPAMLLAIGLPIYWAFQHGTLLVGGRALDDALRAWATARGLEMHTSHVKTGTFLGRHELERYEPLLAPLRRAGFDTTVAACRGVSGRLWGAAPDSTIADVEWRGREWGGTFSVVVIPLPPDVSRRFPGVCLHLRPPGLRATFGGAASIVPATGWRRHRFEVDRATITVHAVEQQDQLALWELLDVRTVEELERRATVVAPMGFGFVVAEGMLVAWRNESAFACVQARARREPDPSKVAESDALLESWLDTVRRMHRRLLEEWQ